MPGPLMHALRPAAGGLCLRKALRSSVCPCAYLTRYRISMLSFFVYVPALYPCDCVHAVAIWLLHRAHSGARAAAPEQCACFYLVSVHFLRSSYRLFLYMSSNEPLLVGITEPSSSVNHHQHHILQQSSLWVRNGRLAWIDGCSGSDEGRMCEWIWPRLVEL